MTKYTTVLFDLDGTLLDFEKAEKTAFFEALTACGLNPTDELHKKYSAINLSLWKAFERGEIAKPDIGATRYCRLFESERIDADGIACNKIYCELLAMQGFTLPGAHEVCQELIRHGIKLYAVTNGAYNIQKSRLMLSGLDKFFVCSFVSEEVGFQKPDINYFRCVLEQIDEKDPRRVIVIGDSPTSDILGGINAGLDTCCVGSDRVEGIEATYSVENVSEVLKILL